ncbi:hypothetical protein ABD440_20175 [Chromobacterium piscinae]
MAALGELHRIAGQVDQYLLQSQPVADDGGGQGRIDLEHRLHFLVAAIA